VTSRRLTILCVVLVVLVVLACALFGAQGPTLVEKPQLIEFSGTPLYSDAGELESFHVTAKFRVKEMRPDGKTPRYAIVPVNFDLVQQGGQTVVLGNAIVEFQDVLSDLMGVSEFAWKLHHPDPLPQHRRALREMGTAK
jgi:hypothetical protein